MTGFCEHNKYSRLLLSRLGRNALVALGPGGPRDELNGLVNRDLGTCAHIAAKTRCFQSDMCDLLEECI
jgi:hypothetical protein